MLNPANVVLVLKKDNAEETTDFRSISLIHSFQKISLIHGYIMIGSCLFSPLPHPGSL
jgi:hypothetical protein